MGYEEQEFNHELLRAYKEKSKEYYNYGLSYRPRIKKLIQQASSQVIRREFSTGEGLNRGYYCPSPIDDIIIGNVKRGKLLNKLTQRSKPTFEYCYDNNERLILVYRYGYEPERVCINVELIEYFENRTISVKCGDPHRGFEEEISVITKSKYQEGIIKSYEFAEFFHPGKPICNQIVSETYQYEDGFLQECIQEDCTFNISFSRLKYCFHHDEEGYLDTYTIEDLDGENARPSWWKGHTFEISKSLKRKI